MSEKELHGSNCYLPVLEQLEILVTHAMKKGRDIEDIMENARSEWLRFFNEEMLKETEEFLRTSCETPGRYEFLVGAKSTG